MNSEIVNGEIASQHISLTPHPSPLFLPIFAYVIKPRLMTFKHFLLASCALVISATAATAQIPSYVPTDGLVGWWPFNGNANDESGNGNDGVVNGATLTEDRNGIIGEAYQFNNQTITVPDFHVNGVGISLGFWFYPSNLDNISRLVTHSWQDFNGGSFSTHIHNFGRAGAVALDQDNILYHVESPNIVSLEEWQHFTLVLTDSINLLYINGFLVDSRLMPSLKSTTRNLYFGGDNSYPFSGKLDDIAIYNRALTPQEIQNLYNGTTETVDTGNGAAPLPQGIPYQAAARDAQGQSLVNAAVNVRFTLHEGAADGAASYAETHALTTNSVGLFNTIFGNGTPEQSAFDSINWAATTKFLQVEIDLGEGYVDMGTTQLLSVPYALRSDEAARVKNAGLPIYNDNAAALAGGLVAGEMYRTAAGVLMVAY